jgi:predicted nuclease of restriction endonuclease-like (RecB) superfamily
MSHPPASPRFYAEILNDIKQRIRQAQTRAILAVNRELLVLYWDIGGLIDGRQKQEGWGAGVIPRLAKDLHNELPEEKGFSERNIKLMVQFFREYPALFAAAEFGQPLVAQLASEASSTEIVQPAVAQIPWAHNVLLMQRVKDRATRLWYAEATLAQGWSRSVLQMQIESAAHTRHGKATSNFALRLPPPQSDLAQQALKDPYLFDFLTLAEPFRERELETGLSRIWKNSCWNWGRALPLSGGSITLTSASRIFISTCCFITCICAASSSSNSSAARSSRNTRAR